MAKVLLVEDDKLVAYALNRYLTKQGHRVIELPNGVRVLETIAAEAPDILVTDLIMPDVEGLEVIVKVRKEYPSLPIIAMSGGSRLVDASYLDTARQLGADKVLRKPFDEAELDGLIDALTA
jgi:CheY-like chemotaxis protein